MRFDFGGSLPCNKPWAQSGPNPLLRNKLGTPTALRPAGRACSLSSFLLFCVEVIFSSLLHELFTVDSTINVPTLFFHEEKQVSFT